MKKTSNPVVRQPRRLVIDTADYWFQNGCDFSSWTMTDRLKFMENALNHTENALIEVLCNPNGEMATKLRAKVAGPTTNRVARDGFEAQRGLNDTWPGDEI